MASSNRNSDEHRRQNRWLKRHRKRQGERDRRTQSNWACEPLLGPDEFVRFAGPGIEAAGTLQRALRAGVIDGSAGQLQALAAATPISRGGTLAGRDAEARWLAIVNRAIRERRIDMTEMREHVVRVLNLNQ